MGILDYFKLEPRQLTLDVATLENWPHKLLRLQRLDKSVEHLKQGIEAQRNVIAALKSRLMHPSLREALPERAQIIHDEHIPTLADAVDDLLTEAEFFGDAFLLESHQESFMEAIQLYRQRILKSVAALREFYQGQLQELDHEVKILEDLVLSAGPLLEEANFESIRQVKLLIEHRKEDDIKLQRLNSLKSEMDVKLIELEEKQARIEARIEKYLEKGHDSRYQEILDKELELRERREDIKSQVMEDSREAIALKAIDDQLLLLRKQMLNDITALNISEQRSFLSSVNDDIRTVKRNLEKIEEGMELLGMPRFLEQIQEHLQGFNVRIEDVSTVYDA